MTAFTKMHGIGNDFVMLAGPIPDEVPPEFVVAICDRRTGIGADGLIVVTHLGGEVVRMDYWNADGSIAEMCGNGLRCTARFALDRGWVSGPELRVETRRGVLAARVVDDGRLTVELGPVEIGGLVEVHGRTLRLASVGNPHAVTEVDDVAGTPVADIGARIGTDPVFPDGSNVEFARVADGVIDLRVWERGVGETLACGSGAAAAAAVAIADGRVRSPVEVHLPGGVLEVAVVDGVAWLTGPVATVFEGELA